MIQRFAYVLSLTWLFWLYLGLFTSLSSNTETQNTETQQRTLEVHVPAEAISPEEPAPPPLEEQVLPPEKLPPGVSANSLDAWLQVNLSKRQVKLYQGSYFIKSYPIAVGRSGWETPKGNFQVQQMVENPNWVHPLTNRLYLNDDRNNPLGPYWIGFWTDGTNWVGFHGTPDPKSVGRAASHGCIRMFNEDISELFYQVSSGTIVVVKP